MTLGDLTGRPGTVPPHYHQINVSYQPQISNILTERGTLNEENYLKQKLGEMPQQAQNLKMQKVLQWKILTNGYTTGKNVNTEFDI